jgi:cardiolipin synthase
MAYSGIVSRTRGVDAGEDRLLTLPNAITSIRVLGVPVVCWLIVGAHDYIIAAVLLAALGITDFLDGYSARHLGQVSTLGKVVDPVADRLLVMGAVASIVAGGVVPLWLALATLSREALVSGAVILLGLMGAPRIDVIWVGKAGTFGVMVAFPLFLLGDGRSAWQADVRIVAWIAVIGALALGWSAVIGYVGPVRRAWEKRGP